MSDGMVEEDRCMEGRNVTGSNICCVRWCFADTLFFKSIDNQRSIGFANSLIDQLCNNCIMIMINLSSTEVVTHSKKPQSKAEKDFRGNLIVEYNLTKLYFKIFGWFRPRFAI